MESSEGIYAPDRVRQLFDRMSESYERMNYLTSFGFSIRWREQFVRKLPGSDEPLKIIDLMTGMGETWSGVRHRYPNAQLCGLDFSSAMLKHAERRNRRHVSGPVLLIQQDVLRNELSSAEFDRVFCAFGLKTFNEEQLHRLAEEVKRILKPGGGFSFIEVSKPKGALLDLLYCFHLKHVVPVVGKLMLGGPAEYRLLWKYTVAYGTSERAAEIFRSKGMKVSYDTYFHGCATGFHGSV